MTVKELKQALSAYPDDMRVVVRGYEAGYNDVAELIPKEIALFVHQDWFYGKHDDADDYKNEAESCVMAVEVSA